MKGLRVQGFKYPRVEPRALERPKRAYRAKALTRLILNRMGEYPRDQAPLAVGAVPPQQGGWVPRIRRAGVNLGFRV